MTTRPEPAFPSAYWPDILRLISLALRDIDVSQASLPPECFRDWLNDPPGFDRHATLPRAHHAMTDCFLRHLLRSGPGDRTTSPYPP